MARYPGAVWRPWFPYDPERYITPRALILHTNAVNAEDPKPQGSLSWHFQVGEHGDIYQHRDTRTRAAANTDANGFAISVETWDGGQPHTTPWNDSQLDSLTALMRWAAAEHKIPFRICPKWDKAGFGYHRMFPEWTGGPRACPADLRARQFHDVLWPRVISPPPAPQPKEIEVPAPAIITNRNGVAEVFIRGVDGQLWGQVDGGSWYPLGGRITSGPAATVKPDGSVRVAARGEDGATWERERTPNGAWTEWWSLGGAS